MFNRSSDNKLEFSPFNNADQDEPFKHKILLFDLNYSGHHAGYIQHLIQYWQEQKLQGCLDILVSPTFVSLHTDIVTLCSDPKQYNTNLIAISSEEELLVSSKSSPKERAFRAFNEWKILCKYARQLKTTECLIMYFDSLVFPLFLGLESPCDLSGIYFRPVFHYNNFLGFQSTWRERFWQWRDKLFLTRILRYPKFKSLFCLDPFVVEPIKQIDSSVNTLNLPDPVQIYDHYQTNTEELKQTWGIESERTIFLMFGAYRPRKGIEELLSAVELLPMKLAEKFCLLLVGPIGAEPIVTTHVKSIQKQSSVQIISHTNFVPDREIQPYFQVADVILAPYQRHIGMSAILVRAAAAQKPVLSSNYGLMGELINRYKLGIAVDTEVPVEIAKGLRQFIEQPPQDCADVAQMTNFAKQNSAKKFATTIFNNMR